MKPWTLSAPAMTATLCYFFLDSLIDFILPLLLHFKRIPFEMFNMSIDTLKGYLKPLLRIALPSRGFFFQ